MARAFNGREDRLRSLSVEAILVGGGGALDQLSRFLIAMLAASILGPATFGTWMLLAVVVQYANVLSLGVASGAARSIPVLVGRGDEEGADRVEAVATGLVEQHTT